MALPAFKRKLCWLVAALVLFPTLVLMAGWDEVTSFAKFSPDPPDEVEVYVAAKDLPTGTQFTAENIDQYDF